MVVLMRRWMLSFVIAAAASLWLGAVAATQDPEPIVVEMTAERFSFSPSEIKAKPGVPIEFRVKSEDTDHGFHILDTDIDVRIPKRGKGTAKIRFTPPAAGRYTIECSHVCGAGHAFMRATVVVK
jgi:cytochrome c oxidase subunit 2